MKRCYHCFGAYGEEFNVCPHCGTVTIQGPEEPIYLWPGTMLNDRYVIGESIGAGGFGIVYRAWDTKLETIVAIKEFFPRGVVTRAEGRNDLLVIGKRKDEYIYRKERFLLEARSMAKFGKHRNIPNVFEFFEANQSAYIVMELLEGETLGEYVNRSGKRVSVDFAIQVANEVGRALISMHEAKIIHRDVAPDNIFLCSGKEKQIKLMDVGSAKIENSSDDVIDLCMKVGYSPVEQYDKTDNFGPWSDVYALGATLYFILTGVKPYESTSRKLEDMLQDVKQLNPEVSDNLNNTIMKAMAINANERFQSVKEFLRAVNGEKKILPLSVEKKRRKQKVVAGILVALAVIAVGFAFGFGKYRDKRKERYLNPATVEIWYLYDNNNPLEGQALETIRQNFIFQEGYEKVEISIVEYTDPKEYRKALEEAAERGKLPAVFESTDIEDDHLEMARDISAVINNAEECEALKQYDKYYTDHKRVPMAIEVPVAYVLTKGASDNPYVTTYDKDIFTNGDFKSNVCYYEEDYACLEENDLTDDAKVYDTADDWSVLYATSSTHNEVKQKLSDKWFALKMVFYKADEIHCRFTYEWSIGNGTPDEINAAEHFLSWMLGANAQANLLGSTGMIPVNEKALIQKISVDDQWTPLEDLKDLFVFGED